MKKENLILSIPEDFVLETTRDLECKISASKLFNGELTTVLMDEIEEILNQRAGK